MKLTRELAERIKVSTISDERCMAECRRLQGMLTFAIATGTELKFSYDFINPATIQGLAAIEKAVTGWIDATLKEDFKLDRKQIPKLQFNLQECKHVDDGDNTVTVLLDFGKILPGERPPEVMEAARLMMERLETDLVAATAGEGR